MSSESRRLSADIPLLEMSSSAPVHRFELPNFLFHIGRVGCVPGVGRPAARCQIKMQARNTPKSGYFSDADPHGMLGAAVFDLLYLAILLSMSRLSEAPAV